LANAFAIVLWKQRTYTPFLANPFAIPIPDKHGDKALPA
jgi:hypothetical protein